MPDLLPFNKITMPESQIGPVKGYVKDDKSLKRLRPLFGDILVAVYRDTKTLEDRPAVDKHLYWSGEHMVLEFSNGKLVEMWNSEWAQFSELPQGCKFD